MKVRLTLFPDRETEVPDDEVEALRAQGLLYEEPVPEPAPRQAAAKAAPKKDGE